MVATHLRSGEAPRRDLALAFGLTAAAAALTLAPIQLATPAVLDVTSGCIPASARTHQGDATAAYRGCEKWREGSLLRMAELHPPVVVMSSLDYA